MAPCRPRRAAACLLLLLILCLISCAAERPAPAPVHVRHHGDGWHSFRRLLDAQRGTRVTGLGDLKRYLATFGYMPKPAGAEHGGDPTDAFDEHLEAAVKRYQSRLSLPVTGRLDVVTLDQMMSPRCGVQDDHGASVSPEHGGAVSRFTFFKGKPRWTRRSDPDPVTLTYAVSPTATVSYLPADDVRAVFRSRLQRALRPTQSESASAEQSPSAASSGAEMKERGGSRAAVDERYAQWKSLIPVLYDWFANHNLVWPSLSCRWGPQFEQATYKNRQRLYLSEQTDGSVPNTLVIANCEVVKPRVAAAEHISQFNEEARSPFVKKYKTIIHPGEVNRIRELPQNCRIIATHTDSPDVLIWDVEAQPNRHAVLGATDSRPDLILRGHQENAEFALAMCPAEPYVLSGGKDKSVVWWSIQDHISGLGDSSKSETSPGASGSKHSKTANEKDSPKVDPRGVFHGHDSTVEDVQFCPSSAQEFCSVGDDACLILWDARTGTSPAVKVEKAHGGDVHCVDWNLHDVNYILTGSADNSVRMWDRRNLGPGGAGSPIHKFEGHKAAVLCVQWSPDKASVFGSSAEDGFLNVWDHEKVGKKKNPNSPGGLFFQHAGHRDKIVDFHWNSSDPWTIVSVSDDGESTGGGGTLQIWRMSDLIYRPEDEVLSELETFKSHLASCTPRA